MDGFAGWSPDGRRIAFVSDRNQPSRRLRDLFVMDADGSNPVDLTLGRVGNVYYAIWSPDGTRIAFTAQQDRYTDLYVIDADGSNLTNLSNRQPQVVDLVVWWIPG